MFKTAVYFISVLLYSQIAADCEDGVNVCDWGNWGPWDDCPPYGYQTIKRNRSLCCSAAVGLDWNTCSVNCNKQYNGAFETRECDLECDNGGTKLGFSSESYCDCAAGYTGQCCEEDINECLSTPCQHDGTCHDSINTFTCDCMTGFYGDFCETGICQPSVADIAFVLDSSISQTEKEFEKQLEFVIKFIDNIIIGDNNLRVAVITYSSDAVIEITFDQYDDKELLKDAVGVIKYRPGATYTDKGLKAAKALFTQEYTPRSNGRKGKGFVFLLTDGMSNKQQQTKVAATELKSYVQKVVAVGVGHEVSHDELLSIASKDDHISYVYSVENFNALHTLLTQLVHLTCDECLGTTTTNVVLLLDSTSTMTLEDFQIAQNALTELTATIIEKETENKAVGLALVTFDTSVTLHRGLNETTPTNDLLPQIQVLNLSPTAHCASNEHCKDSTFDKAIEFTRMHMLNTSQQRNDTRNIVIFLTNGKMTFDHEVTNQLMLLKGDQIFLYVIATGLSSDINTLSRLVEDPAKVFALLEKNSFTPLDALTSEIFFNNCNLTNDFVNN